MNDKIAHFAVGAAISAGIGLHFDPMLGLAAGVLAGAAKEVRDRMGYGTPDFRDFLATALGACVVLPAIGV